MTLHRFNRRVGVAVGALIIATGASAAHAQTMSTNAASLNGGYGRYNGQENRPIENFSNRDASGNMLIVNGVIQAGGSSYASAEASASAYSGGVGAGSSSASAIGNNLNVVTQGNFNTVIVNSTQTNTGAITAGAKTNGGVGNGQ